MTKSSVNDHSSSIKWHCVSFLCNDVPILCYLMSKIMATVPAFTSGCLNKETWRSTHESAENVSRSVASTRLLKQTATGTSDSHNKVYYNERQGWPIGTNTLDKSEARNSRGTEFLKPITSFYHYLGTEQINSSQMSQKQLPDEWETVIDRNSYRMRWSF